MARKRRDGVGPHGEPWLAKKDPCWSLSFHRGPPRLDPADPDSMERHRRWHDDRAKAEARADFIVWSAPGTDEPSLSLKLIPPPGATGGDLVAEDPGRRIVVVVRAPTTGSLPDQGAIANRIAACVNACAGMEDPVAEVARLREASARKAKP